MSFLHLSLLGGLAVISVPIMLHLFGQRQPQLIDFPALKFVRETTQEQRTSWQLRHFLLLMLRVLLLAALALALTRPRVHSAMLGSMLGVSSVAVLAALASVIAAVGYASKRPASVWVTGAVISLLLWGLAGIWGYRSVTSGPAVPSSDQSAPVAAALIIDNGPTMGYRADNSLRLESAKEIALWILDQLPLESGVGVLTGAPVGSLALDPATAETQVKLVELRGAHIDLLSRIRTALDLVLQSELERKEIYVITDLMAPAWSSAQPGLQELLSEHEGEVLLQIIDVGDVDQSNWQLGDPEPDYDSVAAGGQVAFEVDVSRAVDAPATTAVTVELLKEELDPKLPIVRNGGLVTAPVNIVDRKVVDLSTKSSETITLEARELEQGTHHFTIRLDKADPLAVDNERYVSILSKEQRPTLVVSNDPGLGRILQFIVDPQATVDAGGQRLVEQVRYNQLGQVKLDDFEIVCLLDPPPLSNRDAESLKTHVEMGGGLLQILGPGLGSLTQIQGNAIEALLPGELGSAAQRPTTDRTIFAAPVAVSHPLFHALGDMTDDVPWHVFPIFKSWTFSSLDDSAMTLVSLSDNSGPIVLSHSLGSGQVLTFCTPIPQLESSTSELWNELSIGDDPWTAFALLHGAIRTLSGAGRDGMNFQVGSPVSLTNDPQTWPSRYELFLPNAQTRRVSAREGLLSIGDFQQAGVYRLRGVRGDPVSRGFSINAPAADTTLDRVEREQLDEQLGANNYSIAQDRNEVQSSVGQARFGRELYPLLMVFVAGLFLAEQAMSNRFYKLQLRAKQGAVA